MKKLMFLLCVISLSGCAGESKQDPGTKMVLKDADGNTHAGTVYQDGTVRGMDTIDWNKVSQQNRTGQPVVMVVQD